MAIDTNTTLENRHVTTTTTKRPRIASIDAVRALAATLVVWRHFHGAFGQDWAWLPQVLHDFFSHKAMGVYLFFVISGYVIALSTERLLPSVRNIGLVLARRAVRLDPPYLVCIAGALVLLVVTNTLRPELAEPFPSLGQILAHVVYLQKILGYEHIVVVYWSLCYEVQMYLIYVVLAFLERGLAPYLGRPARVALHLVLWFPLLALSFGMRYGLIDLHAPAWCLHLWYLFFIGAQIRWWHTERVPTWALAPVLGALLVLGGRSSPTESLFIVASIIALIAHRQLQAATGRRWIMALGGMSYSLFLIHPLLGGKLVVLGRQLLGGQMTPAQSVGVFVVAFAACLGAAWVLEQLLERPAIHWSRKIKPRRVA